MLNYLFQDYDSTAAGLRAVLAINKVGKFNFWLRLMFYFYSRNCKIMKLIGGVCHNHLLKVYSTEISPGCYIGKGAKFPHPLGIVIGAGCELHENVTVYQNVTLGKNKNGYPCIEDGTIIYPNCSIIGSIIVSRNTILGANSILNKSTESNSVYVGCPARKIK